MWARNRFLVDKRGLTASLAALLCIGGCPPAASRALSGLGTSIVPGVYTGSGTLIFQCNDGSAPIEMSASTSFELTADGRIIVDGAELSQGAVTQSFDGSVSIVTNIAINSDSVLIQFRGTDGTGAPTTSSYTYTRVDDRTVHLASQMTAISTSPAAVCEGQVDATLVR